MHLVHRSVCRTFGPCRKTLVWLQHLHNFPPHIRGMSTAKAQLLTLLENEAHSQRLLTLAKAEPELAAVLEPPTDSEVESEPATPEVPPLSKNQMVLISLNAFVPFLGFGFFDNFLMIVAGDALDTTLCVKFGYATMFAAALGNTVSDIAGIALGGVIEQAAEKLGMPVAETTTDQQRTLPYKLAYHGGSIVGICCGCFLGMVPLLFMDKSGEELRNLQREHEDLCHMVEDKLAALVDADRTSLFVVDQEKQVLVKQTALETGERIEVPLDGDSYIAKCYRSGTALNERHLPESASKFGYEMKDMLVIPVIGYDGVIGVLQMLNKKTGDGFSVADERSATRFATLLAFTLQGGRRADPEQMLKAEAQHLEKEGQRMLKLELFETVVTDLTAVVDADRGSLFLFDEMSDDLFTVAAHGNQRTIFLRRDQGIVGHVVETGTTLNIPNAYKCKFFSKDNDQKTGYKTQSILAVPVKTLDGNVLGAIELVNKNKAPGPGGVSQGHTSFSSEDEQLVNSFASNIAFALTNHSDSYGIVVENFRKLTRTTSVTPA